MWFMCFERTHHLNTLTCWLLVELVWQWILNLMVKRCSYFTMLGKCQGRRRIILNPTLLLQATDPLHNIYFLHSSSFMLFRTVKSSTCKTLAQVIGLKLINSPGLFCLSQPSPSSHVINNKNNTASCLCITSGGLGNRLDYHYMFKNSVAKWHIGKN